jgi:hypothetical protein
MDFQLGKVIAERTFDAIDADGQGIGIEVRLGSPGNLPGSTDVFAPYQIKYGERRKQQYAAGIDGFQALHLAMQMILVEIEQLERRYKLRVLFNRDSVEKGVMKNGVSVAILQFLMVL